MHSAAAVLYGRVLTVTEALVVPRTQPSAWRFHELEPLFLTSALLIRSYVQLDQGPEFQLNNLPECQSQIFTSHESGTVGSPICDRLFLWMC